MEEFLSLFWFKYIALPVLIFLARICDVSLGTIRIMYISKGRRSIVPLLGFFEVLIWILAMGTIMNNLTNWVCFLAYASGFAAGNYVGMIIEEKLAFGVFIVRIISDKSTSDLMKELNENGFGATQLEASGHYSAVNVIWIILDRKKIKIVEELIRKYTPEAVYTIEDVKHVKRGVYPATPRKKPFLRDTFS